MCYYGAGGSQTKREAQKKWKEVVLKDMNDLHPKPSDAINCSKCRKMISGKQSDRSSNSDADS